MIKRRLEDCCFDEKRLRKHWARKQILDDAKCLRREWKALLRALCQEKQMDEDRILLLKRKI